MRNYNEVERDIGDVVSLKSQPHRHMTVNELRKHNVHTIWLDDIGTLQNAYFAVDTLLFVSAG